MARLQVAVVLLLLGVLPLVVGSQAVGSSSSSISYVAASVQHVPWGLEEKANATRVLELNLPVYSEMIGLVASRGAQIVVFPEGGTGWVYASGSRDNMRPYCEPVPEAGQSCARNASLCPGTQMPAITQAAMTHKIVVVLNLCEYVGCEAGKNGCPTDGRYQFDTSVAISESGVVLVKYRKYNLFSGDYMFDRGTGQPITFTTSFGVEFGMFICFDLNFRQPAVAMVRSGIKNFVFSTAWVNHQDAVSVSMQQGFSRAHGVNLIASNIAVYPANGGGGVYAAGEPLSFIFTSHNTYMENVTMATLHSNPTPAAPDHTVLRNLAVSPSASASQLFYPMDPSQQSQTLTASSGNFSCQATYTVSQPPLVNETWILFTANFSGQVPMSPSIVHLQGCYMFQCIMDDTHHCTTLFFNASTTVFKHISITATNFDTDFNAWPVISVKDSQLISPSASKFVVMPATDASPITAELATTDAMTDPLFVFGIYSNASPLFHL